MSTQAHVKIIYEHKTFEEMLWINHDAFPDVVVPKIKNAVELVDDVSEENVFRALVTEFEIENLGNFFTIGPTLNQEMNYIYLIEVKDGEVFLRVQEEFWIEQSETFDKIPSHYLSSEMRTIEVEQL